MHAFVLQDWLTIRGGTGVTLVNQPESGWLDLEPYQDVVFWLQVTEASGSVAINYQTAPTADDSFFASMNASPITFAASASVVVTQILMLSATTPLARYVRWQLTGTSPWDAHFRIMVAANVPGM